MANQSFVLSQVASQEIHLKYSIVISTLCSTIIPGNLCKERAVEKHSEEAVIRRTLTVSRM